MRKVNKVEAHACYVYSCTIPETVPYPVPVIRLANLTYCNRFHYRYSRVGLSTYLLFLERCE